LFLCADGTWKTIEIDSTTSNTETSGLTTTGTLEYFNSDNETTETENTGDTGETSTENTDTENTEDTSTEIKKLYIVGSPEQAEYSTTYTSSKLYLTEDGIYFNDSKILIEPDLDSIEIPNVPYLFELKMNDPESNRFAFEQIFTIKDAFDPAEQQSNSGIFAYMNMQALFSGLTSGSGVSLGFSVSNVIFDSYNVIEDPDDSSKLLYISFNKDFPISISFEGLNLNLKIKINVFFDATGTETTGQLVMANMAIDHNKSSYNLEDPMDLLSLTLVNCVQSCFFLMMQSMNQSTSTPLSASVLPTTCPNVVIVKYQDVIQPSISTLDLGHGEGTDITQPITVKSTDNWTSTLEYKTSDSSVEVSEDWIEYSPKFIDQATEEDFIQGYDYITEVAITVKSNYVDENTPTANRSATITFTGGFLGATTATLTINQAGYNPPVEGEEPEQPSGDICEDCDCDGLFDELGYGFMRYYPETIYQVLSITFLSTFGGVVAQYRDLENKLHSRIYSIDSIIGSGAKPIDEIISESNSSTDLETNIEELETKIEELEDRIVELEEKLNENPKINYKIIINNKDNHYSNILDYIIESQSFSSIDNFEIIQNTDKSDYNSTLEIYHGSDLINFCDYNASTEAKSIENIENTIKRYKPNYVCFVTGPFTIAVTKGAEDYNYTFELDVNGTDQYIMENGGFYGDIKFTVEWTANYEIITDTLEGDSYIEQRSFTAIYSWPANSITCYLLPYNFPNYDREVLVGGSVIYRITSFENTDSQGYSYDFIFN